MVTRDFFEDLRDHPIPSILREPLQKVILDTKRLEQPGEPKKILSMAIQPPKITDIERTILVLKEAGALTLKNKINDTYINNPHDGDLTTVGKMMANLPLDVKLSKLILIGYAFGKLRECIIIAAGLSTKTFFTCYFKAHLESFKAKWDWSAGWMCDCIAILTAYEVYEAAKERGEFRARTNGEKKWGKSHMIEFNRMVEVEKLKMELEARLFQLNIVSKKVQHNESDIHHYLILKAIICAAFYPNYFNGQKVDLQEAQRMVAGRDLKNTVQLKNMPIGEGILYSQKLSEIFKPCANLVQVIILFKIYLFFFVVI